MAMGQQKDRQGDLMVGWAEMPRSPGHVFYDRLQSVLIEGGFDAFAEASCRPYYAARMGAPSVPPGRYFRMHLVGYFEGIDSERGLEWRCSDSLSLREFLRLGSRERVPDHSWLSKTRARLPHEVHAAVFDWVLALIGEAGLVKGERIGVDASTMEANAALRNIVRRDTGEGYREMLEHLARESGIETPTAEDLARLDRKRKGKKLSNEDWVSKSDPEAKIAKMKDGTTHLAYKPEHAVDLDTGAVVAAELHPADEGDTTTLPKTLETAKENLASVDAAPTAEDPAECVTDKGYHSRAVLKALDNGPWKTRIAEPKQKGFARWRGDEAARRAVTNNRTRLLSGVAKEAFKLRAEIVERSFAHNLDRGGMRRTWLRGRENVHKRYLLHVAGHKPIVADAPTHRRRHPARGRGGRIWRYFRAAHAHRGHAGRTGGLAKRPDGFRRRIPHLGVRAGKSHLINGLLSIERRAHANQIQDLKSQLLRLENEKMSTHDSLVHLQAKEQFLEITSLIQFNASLYGIDIWDKRRWDSSYHRYMLSAVGYEDLVKEYRDHVRRITTEFVSDEPFAIAKHGRERAGPSLLQFSRDRTTWVLIPNLSSPP